MSITVSDRANRMVRRRSIVAVILGTVLIITQGLRMDDGGGGLLSWIVWGLAVAAFFVWASGALHGRSFRLLLNDETSDLHRRRALIVGFWIMIAAAMTCYGLTFVKEFSARDAIQIILTCGLSGALLNFGITEQIALRS